MIVGNYCFDFVLLLCCGVVCGDSWLNGMGWFVIIEGCLVLCFEYVFVYVF